MLHKGSRLYALLIILLLATTACQPIQPVSAMKADTARQENQAVVNRFYEEVVNQKHVDVMKEVFDAEMVEHRLTQSHLPLGSNRKLDPHVVYPAKACTIGSKGKACRTLLQAAGK